jgi:hypothetical protein
MPLASNRLIVELNNDTRSVDDLMRRIMFIKNSSMPRGKEQEEVKGMVLVEEEKVEVPE